MIVENSTFTGLFGAVGGNGADAFYNDSDKNAGPGGGGGGGRIHYRALGTTSGAPSFNVSGGDSGVNLPNTMDPWGATAGEDGAVD